MRKLLLAAMLTAAAASVAGCGRDIPPSALVGTSSTPPAERQPGPALAGMTLDGQPFDQGSLQGKVVVINGWASWCAPCRAELPALVGLADDFASDDLAVVGINVSDDPDSARALATETGIDYPSIVDTDGTLWATIPGVPARALPSTVVLDRNGSIAATIVGEIDASELEATVRDLVAERP